MCHEPPRTAYHWSSGYPHRDAGRDCAERELRLPRHPELSRNDDVQGRVEGLGDPGRHGDTAPRQAEDDGIDQLFTAQALAQRAPGMDPIAE